MNSDNEFIAAFLKCTKAGDYWYYEAGGISFNKTSDVWSDSWDNLMWLVDEIWDLNEEYDIFFGYFTEHKLGKVTKIARCEILNWVHSKGFRNESGDLQDAVYRTVIEFIKWYEEKKPIKVSFLPRDI